MAALKRRRFERLTRRRLLERALGGLQAAALQQRATA
jgi:hypothetical protein